MKIVQSATPPKDNNSIPLIGMCVSYNYIDTLKFMLPCNYNYFTKLYIATQPDDTQCIELCNKYPRVEVIFYDFKNKNKSFDKFGAMNHLQKLAYTHYPDHWYLILDSDIILPTNFIEILQKQPLYKDCLYGCLRHDVKCTSDILDKIKFSYSSSIITNVMYLDKEGTPKLTGYFHLYQKNDVYHSDCNNCVGGDFKFNLNFSSFCLLDNLVCLHLGRATNFMKNNWVGKKFYFIEDKPISLQQLYFKSISESNVIYYDSKSNYVLKNDIYTKSGTSNVDVYNFNKRCSYKFVEDLRAFFKDNKDWTVLEFCSGPGFTTRALSEFFDKVYCFNENTTFEKINKEYNNDRNNIEYVGNNVWENMNPAGAVVGAPDVIFMNSSISYYQSYKHISNCISSLNFKYIIFDDYAISNDYRKLIDLSCAHYFEKQKYIGDSRIIGPYGVSKNIHEGLICKFVSDAPARAECIIPPNVNPYDWFFIPHFYVLYCNNN